MRKQQPCATIGKARGNAIRRRLGIERNVGRTRFEDADQGDMQIERTLQPQPDEIALPHPPTRKFRRHFV